MYNVMYFQIFKYVFEILITVFHLNYIVLAIIKQQTTLKR